MTVYEVWDHDPMASNMGRDYLAKTFLLREKAESEADRRNKQWRAYFERTAADGKRRAVKEPWCWRHARIKAREVS